MRNLPVIQSLTAGVLLLLFTLSITSMKTIHDWVAGHEDGRLKKSPGSAGLLDKADYHCNCWTLVVPSPFLEQECCSGWITFPVIKLQEAHFLYHYYTSGFHFIKLRGPPDA